MVSLYPWQEEAIAVLLNRLSPLPSRCVFVGLPTQLGKTAAMYQRHNQGAPVKIVPHAPSTRLMPLKDLYSNHVPGASHERCFIYQGNLYTLIQKTDSVHTRYAPPDRSHLGVTEGMLAALNLKSRTIRAVAETEMVEPVRVEIHWWPLDAK